jgi:hypothetical protein
MCRYLHDVISLNNSRFSEFVDRIYRKILEVMTSTLCSVAALLAATLYQGHRDWNKKLWNIVSFERYICVFYSSSICGL